MEIINLDFEITPIVSPLLPFLEEMEKYILTTPKLFDSMGFCRWATNERDITCEPGIIIKTNIPIGNIDCRDFREGLVSYLTELTIVSVESLPPDAISAGPATFKSRLVISPADTVGGSMRKYKMMTTNGVIRKYFIKDMSDDTPAHIESIVATEGTPELNITEEDIKDLPLTMRCGSPRRNSMVDPNGHEEVLTDRIIILSNPNRLKEVIISVLDEQIAEDLDATPWMTIYRFARSGDNVSIPTGYGKIEKIIIEDKSPVNNEFWDLFSSDSSKAACNSYITDIELHTEDSNDNYMNSICLTVTFGTKKVSSYDCKSVTFRDVRVLPY
jgi:hypothetical protein